MKLFLFDLHIVKLKFRENLYVRDIWNHNIIYFYDRISCNYGLSYMANPKE